MTQFPIQSLHLNAAGLSHISSHPWVTAAHLELVAGSPPDAGVYNLYGAAGACLGTGLFDLRDPLAAWRRFSFAADAVLNESYLVQTIHEALGRRGQACCQRLISSDADYLPGLIVEQYDQLLTVTAENALIEAQLPIIAEILQEACTPQEIVYRNEVQVREAFGLERTIRTHSGNNLKARWVEMDGVAFRLDLLQVEKPRLYLDQCEQYVLVGSLIEGRCVLDAFAHAGGFALHAARNGAEHVVALDLSETCVKAIGANAQRNECPIETLACDAMAFLAQRVPGDFDCVILDPPADWACDDSMLLKLYERALHCLGSDGILAVYCRSSELSATHFEALVAQAAGRAGREGRIFARTGQPFDFPSLLSLPESSALKGLILQVE